MRKFFAKEHPEIVDKMISLWNDDGFSASVIAKAINSQFGFTLTRNAVIGVLTRSGRAKPQAGRAKPQAQSNADRRHLPTQQFRLNRGPRLKSQPIKPTVAPEEPEPIGPLNDFPAIGHCRYTRDDPDRGEWRMCGHPAPKSMPANYPWCDFHATRKVFSQEGVNKYYKNTAIG